MADDLADLECGFYAGLYCNLDGGHLTAEAHRNQSGADLLNTEEFDLGGFGCRIGRFDDSNETLGLDQSYGSHRRSGPESAGVVEGIGNQCQVASTLDGSDDACLLFTRSPCAPGGFDLTGWRDEFDENVEPLVVNFLGL